MNGEGYQNCIYNILFLLQMRIFRQFKGLQLMDDELFRFYFKQLYKNLVKIESTFLSVLKP